MVNGQVYIGINIFVGESILLLDRTMCVWFDQIEMKYELIQACVSLICVSYDSIMVTVMKMFYGFFKILHILLS